MPIEPVALPESPLIIGDRFPTFDEDAYVREAANQRAAAAAAEQAGLASQQAANYTRPEFRGAAGGTMAEVMSGHYDTLTSDGARHANVAGWLDYGAQNIIATKTAINQASEDYHASYEALQNKAVAESWTQEQLRDAKNELVSRAQQRVADIRANFDTTHTTIADGVSAGSTPVRPADVPDRPGQADTPPTATPTVSASHDGPPSVELLGAYDARNAVR